MIGHSGLFGAGRHQSPNLRVLPSGHLVPPSLPLTTNRCRCPPCPSDAGGRRRDGIMAGTGGDGWEVQEEGWDILEWAIPSKMHTPPTDDMMRG